MKRKHVFWLIGYFLLVFAALGLAASKTIHIDPFFHFHKPYTDQYFYPLNNQRSQNNGIVKHFDYSGLITGTSMTENFKTSEAESLWGGKFIKVSFSGGSYKELDDNIEVALRYNPHLSVVIRGLDLVRLMDDKDAMRTDLGKYPTYLYDDNLLNDVHYVFNRDVIFSRVYPMTKANDDPGFAGGITTFDEYANWMKYYRFGKNTLFPKGITVNKAGDPVHITEAEAERTRQNIEQNVVSLAREHPHVTFYYFIPPYSAQWWKESLENGTIYKEIEAMEIAFAEILKCPNIKLFSINNRFDLTTDLNHYKDSTHYGEWINSLMLHYMHDDQYLLTAKNYKAHLYSILRYYCTFDYTQMNDQPDYDDDYYAAFLLAKETYGLEGQAIDLTSEKLELQHAEVVEGQFDGHPGILCTGSLQRDYRIAEITAADFMRDTEFVGFKMTVSDITPYKFITFYGKKITNHGQPTVYIYNKEGKVVAERTDSYHYINNEWKQYVMDVTDLTGEVYIIFNGGYIDSTGSLGSQYVFSDVKIY